MCRHHAAILIILTVLTAGCQPAPPIAAPPGSSDLTGAANMAATLAGIEALPTDTPNPAMTATPGPSPTATLPDVPPVACSGKYAYVMSINKGSELHLADACTSTSLTLPDDAGPALDNWVECATDSPAVSPAWSPDGSRLLYISDYGGSGHGEVHVLNAADGSVVSLTPSYTLLDAATGAVVKPNCASPDECHPGEIKDGQVTFINSKDPRWSPDAAQIMFTSMYLGSSTQNRPAYRTFVMNSDGSHIRSLTDQEAADLSSTWSAQATPAIPSPQLSYQASAPGVSVICSVWHP